MGKMYDNLRYLLLFLRLNCIVPQPLLQFLKRQWPAFAHAWDIPRSRRIPENWATEVLAIIIVASRLKHTIFDMSLIDRSPSIISKFTMQTSILNHPEFFLQLRTLICFIISHNSLSYELIIPRPLKLHLLALVCLKCLVRCNLIPTQRNKVHLQMQSHRDARSLRGIIQIPASASRFRCNTHALSPHNVRRFVFVIASTIHQQRHLHEFVAR